MKLRNIEKGMLHKKMARQQLNSLERNILRIEKNH